MPKRIVTDELTPPPAKSAASRRGWPHSGHALRRGGLASGLKPRLRRRSWRLAAVRANAAPVRLSK